MRLFFKRRQPGMAASSSLKLSASASLMISSNAACFGARLAIIRRSAAAPVAVAETLRMFEASGLPCRSKAGKAVLTTSPIGWW